MAFTSVIEKGSGETAETRLEKDGKGTEHHTRVFTVVGNDRDTDNALRAKNASGLPRRGTPHPQNLFMRLTRRYVVGGKFPMWEVACEYEMAISSDDEENDDGNSPLDEPARIRFLSSTSEEQIDTDVDGEAIVNVNNEPFEQGSITKAVSDLVFTITRNVPGFDAVELQEYKNTVNSAEFLGFPAGTVRCVDIEAENATAPADEFQYWVTTLTFHVRRGNPTLSVTDAQAWYKRVRNEGYLVRPAAGQDPKRALDANDVERPMPTLLKEDGTEETDPAAAHWLLFEVYESKNFSDLNLL